MACMDLSSARTSFLRCALVDAGASDKDSLFRGSRCSCASADARCERQANVFDKENTRTEGRARSDQPVL